MRSRNTNNAVKSPQNGRRQTTTNVIKASTMNLNTQFNPLQSTNPNVNPLEPISARSLRHQQAAIAKQASIDSRTSSRHRNSLQASISPARLTERGNIPQPQFKNSKSNQVSSQVTQFQRQGDSPPSQGQQQSNSPTKRDSQMHLAGVNHVIRRNTIRQLNLQPNRQASPQRIPAQEMKLGMQRQFTQQVRDGGESMSGQVQSPKMAQKTPFKGMSPHLQQKLKNQNSSPSQEQLLNNLSEQKISDVEETHESLASLSSQIKSQENLTTDRSLQNDKSSKRMLEIKMPYPASKASNQPFVETAQRSVLEREPSTHRNADQTEPISQFAVKKVPVTTVKSMNSTDEFLVSARERAASRAQNQGNVDLSEVQRIVKVEIEKQHLEDKSKADLVENRNIAYKRTMEKELTDIRERLEFVTKEYYTFKNEVTPETKSNSLTIRQVQEQVENILTNTYKHSKKLDILDSIFQVKQEDKDLRRSLTDYILQEWLEVYNDSYMKTDTLNKIFDEMKEKHRVTVGDVTELNAKIRRIEATYSLRTEVQSELREYAPLAVVDEMKSQMKQMPTQASLELRLQKVNESFEALQERVKAKYVTKKSLEEEIAKTSDAFEKQFLSRTDFKAQYKKHESAISELDSTQRKISKTAKEQKETLKDLKKSLKDKADKNALEYLVEKLKKYASFADLKELYNKVVPQLSEFEKTMASFEGDHLKFEEMLKRYDEVMAQKANKTALIGVEKKFIDKFAKKDDLEEHKSEYKEKYYEQSGEIEKMNKIISVLNENLSKEIHAAVRKAAKQMESQSNKRKVPVKQTFNMPSFSQEPGELSHRQSVASVETLSGNQMDAQFNRSPEVAASQSLPRSKRRVYGDPGEVQADDWLEIIKKKANQEDLDRLQEIKANKHDSEQQMRALDIMHRQVTHLSILLLELQKQLINEQNESAATMKSRRMFNLEQIVNVTKWIHEFNPQNVNFTSLALPDNLRTLDEFSKVAVKDYPRQNRMINNLGRDSLDAAQSQFVSRDSTYNIQIKSFTSQQAQRRRERNLTGSYQEPELFEKLGNTFPDSSALGGGGLLGSPRASRNLGPLSLSNNNSNQMDRFLKSSVPQARRVAPRLSHIFEKPQHSVDQHNSMQGQTGTFGTGNHRRLQSLAVANSPKVQFHGPVLQTIETGPVNKVDPRMSLKVPLSTQNVRDSSKRGNIFELTNETSLTVNQISDGGRSHRAGNFDSDGISFHVVGSKKIAHETTFNVDRNNRVIKESSGTYTMEMGTQDANATPEELRKYQDHGNDAGASKMATTMRLDVNTSDHLKMKDELADKERTNSGSTLHPKSDIPQE